MTNTQVDQLAHRVWQLREHYISEEMFLRQLVSIANLHPGEIAMRYIRNSPRTPREIVNYLWPRF